MYANKSEMLELTTSIPPTRNHGKYMLIYILWVLDLAKNSLLFQALNIEGREDITSFLEISEQDKGHLEYLKEDTPIIVPKFQ